LCRAVDPEGASGFALQILRHLGIHEREKCPVDRLGQLASTHDVQAEFQPLVGDKLNFPDGRI
jgi:hypothetical protein